MTMRCSYRALPGTAGFGRAETLIGGLLLLTSP
jgi:hypothetical protein